MDCGEVLEKAGVNPKCTKIPAMIPLVIKTIWEKPSLGLCNLYGETFHALKRFFISPTHNYLIAKTGYMADRMEPRPQIESTLC